MKLKNNIDISDASNAVLDRDVVLAPMSLEEFKSTTYYNWMPPEQKEALRQHYNQLIRDRGEEDSEDAVPPRIVLQGKREYERGFFEANAIHLGAFRISATLENYSAGFHSERIFYPKENTCINPRDEVMLELQNEAARPKLEAARRFLASTAKLDKRGIGSISGILFDAEEKYTIEINLHPDQVKDVAIGPSTFEIKPRNDFFDIIKLIKQDAPDDGAFGTTMAHGGVRSLSRERLKKLNSIMLTVNDSQVFIDKSSGLTEMVEHCMVNGKSPLNTLTDYTKEIFKSQYYGKSIPNMKDFLNPPPAPPALELLPLDRSNPYFDLEDLGKVIPNPHFDDLLKKTPSSTPGYGGTPLPGLAQPMSKEKSR